MSEEGVNALITQRMVDTAYQSIDPTTLWSTWHTRSTTIPAPRELYVFVSHHGFFQNLRLVATYTTLPFL